ncbi:MAG: MopE-related protein, partial [bacterium]
MSAARLTLLGLLATSLLAGCAESASTPCDGACTAYQVCAEGLCVRRPCDDASRPCPENGVCVDGECQPDPAAFECVTHTDCDAGTCIEGQCFAPECAEGETRACATACGEGSETCRGGVFRACSAPRPAAVESCDDGRDDDCDGLTDEGCRGCELGATRPCATACGEGTEACADDRWQGCNAPPVEDEICADGRDQDCDGAVDEGCPACADGERRACETACGAGEEICAGGVFAGCDAPAPVDGACPDACPPDLRRPDGEVRLDRGPDAAWFPEILHTGLEFVVAYDDHRAGPAGTTYVQRVAADGTLRGDPVRVADRFLAAAVAAGDQIAVITVEASRLALSTVSRLGRLGGDPTPLM